MILNNLLPEITVDPESYEVSVDGKVITAEPLDTLPLTQRYYLF